MTPAPKPTPKPKAPRKPLRRTPFKRQADARPSLHRETRLERRTKLKASRRRRKCYAHLRDERFKAWVRGFPCLLASNRRHRCIGIVEFAHLKTEGTGGADRGNGVPLCTSAHRGDGASFHRLGITSFQKHWRVDLWGHARRLGEWYEQGAAA